MRLMQTIAAVALTVGLAAMPAAAQNMNAAPNYGGVSLAPGFTPDPFNINLTAGGNLDAGGLGGSCRGRITNAPDYRVQWNGGSNLIISVNSAADTTLVINAPDGRWYCDDDGGEGLNPSLAFSNARGGRYEIWVGTYGSATAPATLSISELYTY